MTLDQLRVFLAVAQVEHVTRAAQALNMTQSAVSAAIAALEARHDVRLFDRVGRNIALTDAGRRFIPHALAVVRQAEAAAGALADLGSGIGGTLRVQASQTVASYWLPPHLVRYRALHPQVALEFVPGNTSTVVAAVLEGAADLGVVEGAVDAPGLIAETVAEDLLAVLVARSHPWADGRRLGPQDLAAATWVLREAASGTRLAFDAGLRRLGLDPAALPVLLELPTNEACIAAVEAGGVATVLSRRAAAPHLAQGLVAAAGLDLAPRVFSAIRHRDRHPSRAAGALLALLHSKG